MKKILSGLRGEFQMALIVALANGGEPGDEETMWSFYLAAILAIIGIACSANWYGLVASSKRRA